jgi:hypothetical protein
MTANVLVTNLVPFGLLCQAQPAQTLATLSNQVCELFSDVWVEINHHVPSSNAGKRVLMAIRKIVFDQANQPDQTDPDTKGTTASEPDYS